MRREFLLVTTFAGATIALNRSQLLLIGIAQAWKNIDTAVRTIALDAQADQNTTPRVELRSNQHQI